ncbi:MAG: hypothetical protein Kow0031_21570 [Anaerolineae bacterium]
MIAIPFLYVGLMLTVLALLRFGVPILVTWLIKMGCCRLLQLKTDRA